MSNGFNQGGGGGVNTGNGGAVGGGSGYDNPPSALKSDPAHDLLLQAFNQALRPYSEKIDSLENEIADLKAYIDQLEGQRGEVHAWIDKRGLRPGELFILPQCAIRNAILISFTQTSRPPSPNKWTAPPTPPARPTPPRR